jgi:tripartite-type tricarboxylate transporter receptor subunit TctC
MPQDIVARLSAEARKVSSQPDLLKRWSSMGMVPKDMAPEQLGRLIREESARNAKVIAEKGIRGD